MNALDTKLDALLLNDSINDSQLVIAYVQEADTVLIDQISELIKSREQELLSYLAFCPVPIRRSHLEPPNDNPLL